ncbi:hypothetical protein AAVH_33841 [Aphelenchoides avenae]|nr:hypothetical protein AAVH_33841 [Aphelenchus avenae]
MDCIGSDGRFIELKTEPANLIASQKLTMKYASWWLQCRLANITELVIGLKPTTTKVDSLKSVRVDSLPGLFDGYRYWTRNDCLYSLHAKLSEIKDILDDARNPEGTVVTLELKSKESRLLAMRIEQPGTSKYAYMYDEIKQRLSPTS